MFQKTGFFFKKKRVGPCCLHRTNKGYNNDFLKIFCDYKLQTLDKISST